MLWYVAFGSALGGVIRFTVGTFIQQRTGSGFPVGTLFINVSGSLLLAFLLRYALESTGISPEVRGLLTTGFCGGYTTFSTFTYESAKLMEDGQYRTTILYIVLSVGASLVGAILGFVLAREVLTARRTL
jgi:CrcB protein